MLASVETQNHPVTDNKIIPSVYVKDVNPTAKSGKNPVGPVKLSEITQ